MSCVLLGLFAEETKDFSDQLTVHIMSIFTIDLCSVHSFADNSPCLSVVCGKFVSVTEVN